MSGPSISVVVCTCDGERYVGPQLRSIVEQTRPPDELVVSDDGSSDGTLAAVRRALDGAACEVTVVAHGRRLGVVANFEHAIALARGDLIVLADQDDVWDRQKLAVLAARYESDPSLTAAFSDAALVDADLRPLGTTLWAAHHFGPREQASFGRGRGVEVVLRRNVVAGSTLSFRSRLRDVVLPMPRHGLHDGWIALLCAALGPVAAVPASLVRYRIHPGNQVGVSVGIGGGRARSRLSPAERSGEILHFLAVADRLRASGADRWAVEVDRKVDHLCRRNALPAGAFARVSQVLPGLLAGRYHRYSQGWRSGVHDLVAAVGPARGMV